MAVATPSTGSDTRVIGLVSAAHFLSHFYIFVLPPLFPVLKDAFGVGYVELGLLITVFNVVSGCTQAPMGFLVDRFGARTLLLLGLGLEGAAFAAMGLGGGYWGMFACVAVAGLANSVYHPADYAILNASVRDSRMGRAFSIHTFSGFLGNAMTPALIGFVAELAGWQTAVMLSGIAGLAVAAVILANRHALDEGEARGGKTAAAGGGLKLLLSLPILMCFLFYVTLAMSASGFTSFATAAFVQIYDMSVREAGWLLTAYTSGNAVGILLGGQIADRTARHELVAIAGFVATAAMLVTVAYTSMAGATLFAWLTVAGVLYGLIMPSRDMLVRAVTPPGSMGKVFGFVSTGLNVGAAFTPVLLGWVMDNGDPRLLFVFAAGSMLLAILTVLAARVSR